jgi:endo-1,4-beta-mannosidase
MYMWQRFDLGELRDDFARIKSLGIDVVRFFLMWEAFSPQRDTIDPTALERFEAIVDALGEAGLAAMPTLFCGHMSGCNWVPSWALDPQTPHGRFRTISGGSISPYGAGDFYADPHLLASQTHLCEALGRRVRAHSAMYAWDLGNEFSNVREPATPADASAWSVRLSEALIATSTIAVTGGTHGEDLERDRGLRLSSLAQAWDFATMHGYSVYSPFSRGRLDVDVVPYLMQLAQSCSGKRVLFSEFGNPTCPPRTVSPYDRVPLPGAPPVAASELPANAAPYACLSEDEMADYGAAVIDRLHARGALGAFWWCWADYDPALAALPPFDEAPHELRFGIIRDDGSFKPVAATLARIAAEHREVQPALPAIVNERSFYDSLPQGIFDRYQEYCAAHER